MKALLRKSYKVYDFVENWPPSLKCALITLPKGHYASLETLMNKKSDSNYNAPRQRFDPPEKPYETESSSLLDLSNGNKFCLTFKALEGY
jgi:hypothetical protein